MGGSSGRIGRAQAEREPPLRYGAVSRAFHWATVALVLTAASFGLWIAHARPDDEAFKLALYNIHESIGVTIWAVTLARLAWRLGHPPPPLPADLPRALAFAARANHTAFYVWLLSMPVVGFVATNAWGFPFSWFGLIPLPDPVGKNVPLAETLTLIHRLMAWSLIGMIVLHVAGALWHQFIRRDGTLRKML
ncbi:cytochrome b [Roseomonas chloroacetimidivorans]|uniref:cytochrome b n=1 Tax=Roseomonas chloroacetimidivorans TaxID=1766656 RepID=UPI003C72C883